ncbi:tRNA lysidine(34) synthetase TilS [Chloroflexota bacterium]
MLEKIRTVLQTKCLIASDQVLIVGVSGGPDSLCLLDVLVHLDYNIIVAHFDHCMRSESRAEAQVVRKTAEDMGIPFLLGQKDVVRYAETHRLSLEEASRVARYDFIFHQAERLGVDAVAIGHNADDQVETVLMHLLRGSGLSGLRGMSYRSLPNPWSKDIPLIRPLLDIWREEIEAYIESHELRPSIDFSNLDTQYYRNRLRHELIPHLESYNPRLRHLIFRMADVLQEDYDVVESLVDTGWQKCLLESGSEYVAFDLNLIQNQPLALQRHILRRGINHLRPGLRDVDFNTIARAIGVLDTPPRSGQIDLISGLRLLIEDDRLYIIYHEAALPSHNWPQLDIDVELVLNVPDVLKFNQGWRLSAELTENGQRTRRKAITNNDPFQAWIDFTHLQLPLLVRTRRPGDRIKPLGMDAGSLKLSDLMVNLKLPRRVRNKWPVVTSASEIIWVPGMRLAHKCRLTEDTEAAVHLTLAKEGGIDCRKNFTKASD